MVAKKVIVMGCENCPYYVGAVDEINRHPNYQIAAHYRHPDLNVYKKNLQHIQDKSDRWSYLSEVREKFKKIKTSPVIIIPADNFVGGYDDVIMFFRKHQT